MATPQSVPEAGKANRVSVEPKTEEKSRITCEALVWAGPLLTAGLLYLSFFPVAIGWFAWIALIPWLSLVRLPRSAGKLYLASWVGGIAFFMPVLQWARVADPRMYVTWVVLALWCSFTFPIALGALRWLDAKRRVPLLLAVPTVFVTLEYFRWGIAGGFATLLLRTHQHDIPGGFSWYFIGHSQHDFLEIIQICDITGVYGVTFLVSMTNTLLFEMAFRNDKWRSYFISSSITAPLNRGRLLMQGLIVAVLLLATLGYGIWQLQVMQKAGPVLAMVQGNHDQRLRNTTTSPDEEAAKNARAEMERQYDTLCTLARKQRPTLIVWPETSFPGYWVELDQGRPNKQTRDQARDVSITYRTPMLLGMISMLARRDKSPLSYNSAVLIDKEGQLQGKYDKIHRVPFGEYVPFRSVLPFLNYFAPYDYDFSVQPGINFTRFTLPNSDEQYQFGVLICYEDTDPSMSRPYVLGKSVDFLVNISNDGWFIGTSEHDQHLALCRFRAIECRRSVARSVNMGISGIIDSCGRVLTPNAIESDSYPVWQIEPQPTSLPVRDWHRFKNTAGVFFGQVPIDSRISIYAACGDVFAWMCCAMLLISLGFSSKQLGGR